MVQSLLLHFNRGLTMLQTSLGFPWTISKRGFIWSLETGDHGIEIQPQM
jgi:hypothetical protein